MWYLSYQEACNKRPKFIRFPTWRNERHPIIRLVVNNKHDLKVKWECTNVISINCNHEIMSSDILKVELISIISWVSHKTESSQSFWAIIKNINFDSVSFYGSKWFVANKYCLWAVKKKMLMFFKKINTLTV